MNRVTFAVLVGVTLVLSFCQARGLSREALFGTRIDVVPVLVTYAALRGDLIPGMALAALAGLVLDCYSATPLGTSVTSLGIAALGVSLMRGLVLRDQVLAQALLGGLVAALHPVMNLMVLWVLGLSPIVGWGSLIQLVVLALSGAVLAPFFFLLFDWLETALTYDEESYSRFRTDVEIKRGRG